MIELGETLVVQSVWVVRVLLYRGAAMKAGCFQEPPMKAGFFDDRTYLGHHQNGGAIHFHVND